MLKCDCVCEMINHVSLIHLATFKQGQSPGNSVPHSLSLSSRFLTVMEVALLSAALLASVVTFKNAVIMRGGGEAAFVL